MSKEQQATLNAFADVHSDVVRKIAAGNATLIDMERLRAKAWELERTDNDILTQFAQRALAHVEAAFKAYKAAPGRRKQRLLEKMHRKGDNFSQFLRNIGVDDAEVAETANER